MKVTKNITIDLNNPRRHTVHLMESGNQREIVLTLLKDGMPFDVSEGIGTATLVAGVHYIKANGIGGYYDWTSTDLAAVVLATGTTNVWNVLIDEHATDVPGFAEIFVTFSLASGETLHSFPITLDVIRTSGGTTDPDSPWYHSSSFILAGAQAPKTGAMTQPIGIDSDGKLWAEGGWSAEAKEALLACFNGVAWDEGVDGQALIDNLEDKLYPTAALDYIVADYVQDRTIYDNDSLEKIKEGDDLIVTAYYDDGTHIDLSDSAYTLSGTLTAGTSTITVSYGGKTTTISVTVTHNPVPATYQRVEWVGNTEKAYVWSSAYNMNLPSAFRIEAKTKLDDFNANATVGNILACFQPNASSYGLEFGYSKTSGILMVFAGGTSSLTPADLNAILTCGVVCDGTNVKVFIDNNGERTYGSEASASRNYTSTNYGLFYAGTSATSYNQLVGRIYYLRIYNSSDELIAEYLPCYRKSDNVIGFYETVGEVFYTNDGSGSFTKGGDI